jgi:hypothetical protein
MHPLTLVPWHEDFMPALKDVLTEREDFGRCIVLFPHNRPRRYLKALFKADDTLARPVFLPRMTSIADFVSGLRRDLSETCTIPANRLDLVALLRDVVNDLRATGRGLLAELPKLDQEGFLPWGIRLARLMDDLLRQGIEPEDLAYMEGEVSPYASALLEQLGSIHHEYVTRLFDKGWTTPGLDWRFVTSRPDDVAAALADTPVVAAGFYALSGAEDQLFKRLWEDGLLHPVIHSDPALALGGEAHHAVAEHAAWLRRWGVRPELRSATSGTPARPAIRFCEGFDRHSQLAAMADDLRESEDLDGSAIILPDEGALLPVLHHLPDKEPNISMGYPLERTSLARLVETLLTLQENRLEDGRYHWRDVITLIRHPYLRLLGPEDKPLRRTFHVWEAAIRQGERYLRPLDWQPPYGDETLDGVDPALAEPLRQDILRHCLTRFENVTTLRALGDALSGLAAMLHAHGERLWHTYLVDAECLFRLTTSVIPQLRSVESDSDELGRSVLFSLLRQLMGQERVSFEPEPLGGLQVLGVLETRLLHFKKLYVLDAVEERLPGTNPYDPLLPDPLRKLLRLPDSRERDNVSAYNFHRLLMGAEEAVIYYQSGIQPGLLDSKSVRSRFVEQLLWERERNEERIVERGDPLIRTVNFPAGHLEPVPRSVPVTDAIRDSLRETLQKRGLSPSSLDRYMLCPKHFFYAYLGNVRPVDEVDEDGDRAEFGSLMHEVLREFLAPYVGRKTDLAGLDPTPLLGLFDERFHACTDFAHLPLDTRMALNKTGRFRLAEYLASQEPATLLGLEKRLENAMEVDGLAVPLSGQADRIEERAEGVFILDYKTGGGVIPGKKSWQDMDLWDRVRDFGPDHPDPMLLNDLAKAIKSVQLPVYLYLYNQISGALPHDGGLVKLSENGKTDLLFGKKWTEEERAEAVDEMTPQLVQTLVRHMLLAPEFPARPGPRCQWCDFKTPCGQ